MSRKAHPLREHGGRLSVARAMYPDAPEPWIDLSTGINPEPYPAPRAGDAERARLPDRQQLKALEATAGQAFGVNDPHRVLATAGSEAALRLLPHVLGAATALVVGPTYSSHADAWHRYGSRVMPTDLSGLASPSLAPAALGTGGEGFAEATLQEPETAVHSSPPDTPERAVITLVNPNNPDGAILARERVLALHDRIAGRGGHLVVDEAFADVTPACSVASLAGTDRYPNLVVLRSFGKFFGLAGLRLGFVIAAPAVVERYRHVLGDWPLSADAIAAGLAAYADTAWAHRQRGRLSHAANRLDELLIRSGLQIVGGTTLFRLARCHGAEVRFERLLRAGILVRPFDHDPTLLRFGLPHGDAAWARLAAALRLP